MTLEIVFSLGSGTSLIMFSSSLLHFFSISFLIYAVFSYLPFLFGSWLVFEPTFHLCPLLRSSQAVMAQPLNVFPLHADLLCSLMKSWLSFQTPSLLYPCPLPGDLI